MRCRRARISAIRGCRQGLIASALLAFFVAAVGVPIPGGVRKDRSVAFPCMERACGCHDASACKKHCCCFSNDEKLAWAAEHNVAPVAFVDDQVLARQEDEARRHRDARPARVVMSCCAKKETLRQLAERRTRQRGADQSNDVTIAAHAQCNGLSLLWTLVNGALEPPEQVRYEFDWTQTGHVVQPPVVTACISFPPATPPPRV